jgi:hypothetical protein
MQKTLSRPLDQKKIILIALENQIGHKKEQQLDRILVTGNLKTGSTALFYSIKNALPKDSICLFEPDSSGAMLPEGISVPVLVKCFMERAEAFDHFNKKILITRDPRDQIISQMLYRPFNIIVKKLIIPQEQLESVIHQVLGLIQDKVNDPRAVSVREIRGLLRLEEGAGPQERLVDYYRRHRDVMIFKYEDYVDGRLDQLNKYLGLTIKKSEDIPVKRVIRSKSYGNWKDWFTPGDVEYYKTIFGPYMEIFGYPDNWELNPQPAIDPSTSYSYVEKLIAEARGNPQK